MSEFTVKKFDGDDEYSYAVFRTKDVKGMGNQIFYGQAKPYASGLSKEGAQQIKRELEGTDRLKQYLHS